MKYILQVHHIKCLKFTSFTVIHKIIEDFWQIVKSSTPQPELIKSGQLIANIITNIIDSDYTMKFFQTTCHNCEYNWSRLHNEMFSMYMPLKQITVIHL